MANIEGRPYNTSWKLQNRKTIKLTPDVLVYVNGDTSIAGCPTCNGKVDLQRYITSVSVDPSVEGPCTATISLSVPFQMGDGIVRDGQLLIHTGLEVHIYFRGYFTVDGILSGVSASQTGGVDVSDVAMYPYYLAFHGVMTDVSYEYSGGAHTMSISCADLLHFWQYQFMNTNAAAFGVKTANSKADVSLVGNVFTGMSPYAIIYSLFRDIGGAQGGVTFALSNETNASAMSSVNNTSLVKWFQLYWANRFAQNMTSLRMYGADGELYNAKQAAFVGTLTAEEAKALGTSMANRTLSATETNTMSNLDKKLAAVGFDPYSLYSAAASEDDSEQGLSVNVAQLQAFVLDIGNMGQVNFFESQYETKLDIANHVKEVTGFEFYQDVDGDIVFKPHFYNLDTSSSRVYRIEPIDIISFNMQEKEPECTVVNATSGHFQNTKVGGGLEGEWGTRAEFVDYRLVAQYGWRQKSLGESSFYSNKRALFFACVAQMDVFNIGTKTASCTIPIRPELRPGYPVYIQHLDCFYYLQSMSHSFSFGGSSTTTLNLVGKRAKFFAPGKPPSSGKRATVDDIDLSNPYLPELPLELKGADGLYRIQGFPNVVLTIDTEGIDPLNFFQGVSEVGTDPDAVKNLVKSLATKGILNLDTSEQTEDLKANMETGPWTIATGNGTEPKKITLAGLTQQASQFAEAASTSTVARTIQEATGSGSQQLAYSDFAYLLNASKAINLKFADGKSQASYLDLLTDLKATYNPGGDMPGYYRYYSSSHPIESQQGTRSLTLSAGGTLTAGAVQKVTSTDTVLQFVSGSNSQMVVGTPTGGIPLIIPGQSDVVVTPTHQILALQIAKWDLSHEVSTVSASSTETVAIDNTSMEEAYTEFFLDKISGDLDLGSDLSECKDLYEAQATICKNRANFTDFGKILTTDGANTQISSADFVNQLQAAVNSMTIANEQAPITINPTSDHRDPAAQANAMTKKIFYEPASERDLHVPFQEGDLYNSKAGREAIAAVPAGSNFEQTEAALTAKMTEQVGRNPPEYVSEHMTQPPTSIDISVQGLTDAQQDTIREAGQSLGATTKPEGGPAHIHFSTKKVNAVSNVSVVPMESLVEGDFSFGDFVATASDDEPVTNPNTNFANDLADKNAIATLGVCPGTTTDEKYQYVAATMAHHLAIAVETTIKNIKDGLQDQTLTLTIQRGDRTDEYTTLDPQLEPLFQMAFDSCMPNGTVQRSGIPARVSQKTSTNQPHVAPVFPVSDGRGYEVVGTYAYGRGVSIEPGGSFYQIQQRDRTDNTTFDATETWLKSITVPAPVSTDAAATSPESAAAQAADMTVTSATTATPSVAGTEGSTQDEAGYKARQANANHTVQKLSVINSAYSLADMKIETDHDVCSCKASQAATLLTLFSDDTKFTQVDTESVTAVLQEMVQSTVSSWQSSQDAYRGAVVTSTKPSTTG